MTSMVGLRVVGLFLTLQSANAVQLSKAKSSKSLKTWHSTAKFGTSDAGAQWSDEVTKSAMVRSCFGPGHEGCDHWLDEDGERIEAHGAGMLWSEEKARWYWYGESAKGDATNNLAGSVGGAINCYSSKKLTGPWKNHGEVLHQSKLKVKHIRGPYVVERPKVLYNEQSKKYVMWFHADTKDYQLRSVGVATSKQPEGPFYFSHVFKPDGVASLDMSLYQDHDGQAYFVRSVENTHFAISKLTEDFMNTTGVLSSANGFLSGDQACLEGFAMFRQPFNEKGKIYMMTSHCDYWNPNPLSLLRMDGPNFKDPKWKDLGNPSGDDKSFNSQPNFVVQHTDEQGWTYPIYMGDNWINAGDRGLPDASYVWLPLDIKSDGKAQMEKKSSWTLAKPFVLDHSYDRSQQCKSKLNESNGNQKHCWVRLPDGCQNKLGESDTPRSWFVVSDEPTFQGCTQRLADFKVWCESETAEHTWSRAHPDHLCRPKLTDTKSCWISMPNGCDAWPKEKETRAGNSDAPCWVNHGGCFSMPGKAHFLETSNPSAWFLGMDPEVATYKGCAEKVRLLNQNCSRSDAKFDWSVNPQGSAQIEPTPEEMLFEPTHIKLKLLAVNSASASVSRE